MAGVVRRDVELYKHVTGCDYTCSLDRRPKKIRKSQKHTKPLPSEKLGGREAVSLVKGK